MKAIPVIVNGSDHYILEITLTQIGVSLHLTPRGPIRGNSPIIIRIGWRETVTLINGLVLALWQGARK